MRAMEYVIGWMNVRPGQRARFIELCRDFVEASRAEDGVLFFELLESLDHPDVVVAIEGYASAQAHERHVTSAHFRPFLAILERYVLDGRFENVAAATTRTDLLRPGHPG
jgi:quinol monooxygenase YgiN